MPVPKSRKAAPFAWRPVAIYVAVVIVVGAGLVLWDRAYVSRQTFPDLLRTQPEVVAKNLVENVVGAGTVQAPVTLDRKTETVTLTVRDVVTDKGKTTAQKQELLSGEGRQAVESILGAVTFKHIVLKLVKDGKVLATVRGEPGKTPQTEFAPDLK